MATTLDLPQALCPHCHQPIVVVMDGWPPGEGPQDVERLRTERDAMRAAIDEHAKRMGAVLSMPQGPKSAEEGLRFLAVWFDMMYPDDPDTQVQDDLRRWSADIERLRADLQKTLDAGATWERAYWETKQELAELRRLSPNGPRVRTEFERDTM